MDHLYLANLEEFIIDEIKVISYKWLSLTLSVSANEAKQMLFHFVDQHKASHSVDYDLHITYLVSGLFFNEDTSEEIHKVCIVHDSELATVKSRMSKTFSIHIYSVQRAKLADLNLLYVANYDKVKEDIFKISQYSHIKCSAAQRRSSVEHEAKLQIKSSVEQAIIKKDTVEESKENKVSIVIKQESKEDSSKPLKSGGIASLFANQAKKGKSTKNPLPSNTSKSSKKKGTGPLSAFLTKVPARPVVLSTSESTKKESDTRVQIKDEEVIELDSVVKEEIKDIEDESPFPPKREKPINSIKIDGGGKKQKRTKASTKRGSGSPKGSSNTSKRRRIVVVDSDSSSQGESEDDASHEECPLPPPPMVSIESDDEEMIPCTPQEKPSVDILNSAKGRSRKLVDNTFTDDEGFFVTKKEFKLVSDDSDGENPLPPKKKSPSCKENTSPKKQSPKKRSPKKNSPRKKTSPKKAAPKKRKISPPKKNQASITNFFKKM